MAKVVWQGKRGTYTKEYNNKNETNIEDLIERGNRELEQVNGGNKHMLSVIRKFYIGGCTLILVALNTVSTFASTSSSVGAVDELGNVVISSLQNACVYVFGAMCLFDILKAAMDNDPKRIPASAAKFAIGLLIVYLVPEFFFTIRDKFAASSVVNGGAGLFNSPILSDDVKGLIE